MALSAESPTYLWKIVPDPESNAATFYYTFGELALAEVYFAPREGAKGYFLPVRDFDDPLCAHESLEEAMASIETAVHVAR